MSNNEENSVEIKTEDTSPVAPTPAPSAPSSDSPSSEVSESVISELESRIIKDNGILIDRM
jgi:hypothetical protein